MAAVLAGGQEAFLAQWATCALAGLMRWNDRPIDVTVRGSAARRRAGIRFHRARSLDPRDTTRIHGIPTTTPARAILEIAPQLSDRRLKRLVRQAQAEKLASVGQFEAMLGRANGHAGTRRIAAIIATGAAPTYSGDEDEVLDLVLDEGFEHPEVNQPLVVGPATARTPYFPDLRWPAQRLILEIDSAWHDGPALTDSWTPSARPSSRPPASASCARRRSRPSQIPGSSAPVSPRRARPADRGEIRCKSAI